MKTEGKILAQACFVGLREALQTETDPKAIKRLVTAIEYKSGASPATIAEKYGWSTQTVYNWLYQFAERVGTAERGRARHAGAVGRVPRMRIQGAVQ